MPPDLDEVSGLVLTPDARLLAHADQRGEVVEIDYRHGVVVKRFALGKPTVRGDFEAITMIGDTAILLTSTGTLYMFEEGENNARVGYSVHETGLGRECEFEGLAFDPKIHALLFACKTVHTKALQDALVIFRWTLERGKSPQLSRLTVPLSRIIGSNGWTGLHPSDITVDPFSGNYVIVASREKALIGITPAGGVVFARPLPGKHAQPEGVAITRDSLLIVSDERPQPWGKSKHRATSDAAALTMYHWPLAPVRPTAP